MITTILPVVADTGTVTLIDVDDTTVNAADAPLNFTDVVSVKPEPVIVIIAPTCPDVGVKLIIFGSTTKLPALVAVPPDVVTDIVPVDAVAGTVALIDVDDKTVNVADTPLNFTDVAPVKPEPVIVTTAPAGPDGGLKLVIFGNTKKLLPLIAFTPDVTIDILPVVAATGTVALMEVDDNTVNVADTPLNLTDVVPVKLVPVMVTSIPTSPDVGVKLVMVGFMTVNVDDAVLLLASLADTVWAPVVDEIGTVNVTPPGMLPVGVAVTVPGDVGLGVPSYAIVI